MFISLSVIIWLLTQLMNFLLEFGIFENIKMKKTYLYSTRIENKMRDVFDVSWDVSNPPYCFTCGKDPARNCECYHNTNTRHQLSINPIIHNK